MLFNSLEYALFFPAVILLYFGLPYRFRPAMLLAASCLFYMAFVPVYILILGFTIVIDYIAGILIEGSRGQKRKWMLVLSLAANIGVLAVFKYYNWIAFNFNTVSEALHTGARLDFLTILLPIGLSFHTFQAMSYTIEVYRGKEKAERNFLLYSLYVMFFPQLVAGPIERPQNVLYQFREKHDFNYRNAAEGLKLIAWGLFKKICVADNLAQVVANVYGHPADYEGIPVLISTFFFAVEIYCDFSGYSDIALGSAQVMGFRLMENFRRPYFSLSVTEFWSRWHISLSSWFRDYVYIPLGGNRVSVPRYYLNIFIVFMLSGLWHGASWNFVIWGALHGIYRVTGTYTLKTRKALAEAAGLTRFPVLHNLLNQGWTFLLVSFGWIFFRAATFADAMLLIKGMFRNIGPQLNSLLTDPGARDNLIYCHATKTAFFNGLGCMLVLLLVETLKGEGSARVWLAQRPPIVKWGAYYSLILCLLLFAQQASVGFIYFQF
ncbi:MAG: MBOAT family O-acyltransferase [Bacteroidota bacterium]